MFLVYKVHQNPELIGQIATVALVMMLVLLPLLFYLQHRNKQLLKFELLLIKLCYEYNIRHLHELINDSSNDSFIWCYDKLPNYYRKLFSFKKLTLESYLSEEQYNKLKS